MTQITSNMVAIAIGLSMVGGALYISGGVPKPASADGPKRTSEHRAIYGEKNAAVTIVEFSDLECPYCARLHTTLTKLVDESDGLINWEYRHLPLSGHRNAHFAAVVSECALRTLSNDAFWLFTDTAFKSQLSFSRDTLTDLGVSVGLSEKNIAECEKDEEILAQIETDKKTAQSYGGSGTPFSVVVDRDGTITPVRGALPIQNWQSLLNLP